MRIDVWQMVRDDRMHYMRFEDYETYKRESGHEDICPDDYELVYVGNLDCEDLNAVFWVLNSGNMPEGYIGHSLSVSDIVHVFDGDDRGLWYCEPFGWTKVHWGAFNE